MFPSFFILRDEKIYKDFRIPKVYIKFWTVSLENFFKHKLYVSEEWSSFFKYTFTQHIILSRLLPKENASLNFFCGYEVPIVFRFFYTSSQIKYVSALKQ